MEALCKGWNPSPARCEALTTDRRTPAECPALGATVVPFHLQMILVLNVPKFTAFVSKAYGSTTVHKTRRNGHVNEEVINVRVHGRVD